MSDKQGLIQLTQVVHPSALSAMSRVRFNLNYIIILGSFSGREPADLPPLCLPSVDIPLV